jgi:mono/diheme cytochrome c family protein
MWNRFATLSGLALLCIAGLAQDAKKTERARTPSDQKTTTEDANLKNPVKENATSMAENKRIYALDCIMCHGFEGDGKGDLAQEMKLTLHDWRDPASLRDFADGELFQIISKGKGKMPGDEARMKPDQIWHMINFIRSFTKRDTSPNTK